MAEKVEFPKEWIDNLGEARNGRPDELTAFALRVRKKGYSYKEILIAANKPSGSKEIAKLKAKVYYWENKE